MIDRRDFDDTGKLILRLSVAGLLLLHGIHKIRHGVGGIESDLEGYGLPGLLAYGVYVGEVVAPLLVIVGFQARLAALVMAFNMVVAIGMVHAGDVLSLNDHGGWGVELAGLYLLGSVAIAFVGPGRFSVLRS